jgi:tRNA(fMet)-specific endonuclease VapC
MSYLLDAGICVALINGSSANARSRFAEEVRRRTTLTTSAIAVHQLWHRAAKGGHDTRFSRAVAALLSHDINVLNFTEPDSRAAGEIRAELERQGTRIGEYDTLIAGQAFARNLILVTANTNEFARVKGLIVEDWTV